MATNKQIDKAIGSFVTNRNKLRDQAHKIAMMIFLHAAPKAVGPDCDGTGDCSRAILLIREMPKSWAEQMTVWFKEYTPIRVNVKNDKCEYDPKYKKLATVEEKLTWWKLSEANETPFYAVIEEPDVQKEFNLEHYLKMLERMPARIEKDIKEGKVPESDVESVKALARLVATIKVTKTEAPVPANEAGEEGAKSTQAA